MGELIERTGHEEKTTRLVRRDIKRRLDTIRFGIRTAVGAAWDAGSLLTELKRRTPHGEWLPFLDSVDLGERQAQKYMRLFRSLPREQALSHDTIASAMRELASPAEPKAEAGPGDGQGDEPAQPELPMKGLARRVRRDLMAPGPLDREWFRTRAREMDDDAVRDLAYRFNELREVFFLEMQSRKPQPRR